MNEHHIITNRCIVDGVLHLTVDGYDLEVNLRDVSSAFANASELEMRAFEVTPSGYGLHWPLLDEDISIDGLLGKTQMLDDEHHFTTRPSNTSSAPAFAVSG
ncbi:DUF2442 domain-containing protein [Desulfonatronum lacustre]|uniref:DUF2442 domain-containing protein n=1 Tax=Desulfonatronum lacustre TaxID=66849 RepID=UPI000A0171E8|nr:DUF2442 domain-containing protein [Desulfonatronum lacustre]